MVDSSASACSRLTPGASRAFTSRLRLSRRSSRFDSGLAEGGALYETRRIPGGILHFSLDIKQRSVRYSRAMKLSSARARKLAGMRKTHGAGSARPRSLDRCPCGTMTRAIGPGSAGIYVGAKQIED